MKWILVFAAFIVAEFSCNKNPRFGPLVVPSSLIFLVKKAGDRLPDSILNNMKLYYYQNGTKKYFTDFIRGINEGDFQAYDSGVQTTRNIGFTSGDDNIKTYYLEYPSGQQDTLFIDYRHVGEDEAFHNSCYCYFPLQLVKFDGQVAITDPTITQQKVYLFSKP